MIYFKSIYKLNNFVIFYIIFMFLFRENILGLFFLFLCFFLGKTF